MVRTFLRASLVAAAAIAATAPADSAKVKSWQHHTAAHHDKARFKHAVISNEGTLRLSRQLKQFATTKFNQTVEVSVNLGIDPRQSDQNVRGSVALPHGIGKAVRVAVFAQGENAEKARAAGADIVGADDLAQQIKAGVMDFDALYCIVEGTSSRVTGEAQARALTELVAEAARSWSGSSRRAGLLVLDEFSAVSGRVPVHELTERCRSLGTRRL